MVINILNSKWLPLALLSLGVISGCCCQAYPLPGEDQCPTDARRIYLSCGEEAVRRCPCGPDREFYGLKPTNWRAWPDGWRCGQGACSSFPDDSSCAEPVSEERACAECDLSNPFRSEAGADVHPQQPNAPEALPAQVAPSTSVPVQAAPARETPAAMPSLEKAPAETAPLIVAPAATAPAAPNPTTEIPPANAAPVNIIPPQPPAVEIPSARITPVEITPPTPPQTTPPVKPPAKSPPATPPQQPASKSSAMNQDSPARPPLGRERGAERQPAGTKLSNRVEEHLFNNLQM